MADPFWLVKGMPKGHHKFGGPIPIYSEKHLVCLVTRNLVVQFGKKLSEFSFSRMPISTSADASTMLDNVALGDWHPCD